MARGRSALRLLVDLDPSPYGLREGRGPSPHEDRPSAPPATVPSGRRCRSGGVGGDPLLYKEWIAPRRPRTDQASTKSRRRAPQTEGRRGRAVGGRFSVRGPERSLPLSLRPYGEGFKSMRRA